MTRWPHSSSDRATREGVADEIRAWLPAAADSPIYTRLAERIAEDAALLDLVARIDNVPPMNLLFGAVQFLRGGPLTELPYDEFREFVLDHEQRIVEIGCSRRTQTNEARRAAVILPFVASAVASAGAGPVHLVEIGAAAGLVTCLDRYSYDYGSGQVGDGELTLTCENRGGFAVPDAVPQFATRTGLDLAPVHVDDREAVAWLEALVWPEHAERLDRLRRAIAVRRQTAVSMVAGDALEQLPSVVEALPPGPVVIQHTVALYQMNAAWHSKLDRVIVDLARTRSVSRVAFEPHAGSLFPVITTELELTDAPAVAVGHHHGVWVDRAS